MSAFELPRDDPWVARGYGQASIEPGAHPAVLVVDLQYAFTDPAFPMGGAGLVVRAVEGTARVCGAARQAGVPVFQTVVAWREDGSDLGHWPVKLPLLRRVTLDSRWAQVDARVWDESDVLLVKKWPSFFHGTPLTSLLAAAQRDTVIVTGCMTSGCVRATTVDAFSYGYRTLVPEDCVGDQGVDGHVSNLRDVHRRYAEVTAAECVIEYLETVVAEVPT
jgi:maleamate amidohydrolase